VFTSTKTAEVVSEPQLRYINLRDPWLAAFLAWLVPGLGHMYQRRWGKGGLFMTCILATFFYGLWLGGGRVVYASFREGDSHYAYLCQVGVGLPALPALVQAQRMGSIPPKAPWLDGFMAPPMLQNQIVPRYWVEEQHAKYPNDPELIAFRPYDPHDPRLENPDSPYMRYTPEGDRTNQLGYWHYKFGAFFDLGTVFTMIAGLLNILAIWDAWGGPMIIGGPPDDEKNVVNNGELQKVKS
jgi:hypothetical protein